MDGLAHAMDGKIAVKLAQLVKGAKDEPTVAVLLHPRSHTSVIRRRTEFIPEPADDRPRI